MENTLDSSLSTLKPRIKLPECWLNQIGSYFETHSMQNLRKFLLDESKRASIVYPRGSEIFAAFHLTPFYQTKVVIIGQDPYHGAGQAHGLAFSVNKGIALPPSLRNIFRELQCDLGVAIPKSGDLSPWAMQGVLLLNSVLTVQAGLPGSHQNRGWELFTDHVVKTLSQFRENLVFVLWGTFAQKKRSFIDSERHVILSSAHPSPLSAHRGFFGSKPFSKINQILESRGVAKIDWRL